MCPPHPPVQEHQGVSEAVDLNPGVFVATLKILLTSSTGHGSQEEQLLQILVPQMTTHMAPHEVDFFFFFFKIGYLLVVQERILILYNWISFFHYDGGIIFCLILQCHQMKINILFSKKMCHIDKTAS